MRLLLLLLLWLPFVGAVEISEVMYDPVGDDISFEFVEIFGTDNLSNYTFGDLAVNQTLTLLSFVPGNFSVLVSSSFSAADINASVYTPGAKLGNGLGNSGDTLFLYENGSLVTSVSYTSTFAHGDGYSLELVNGTVQSSSVLGGTPGYFFIAASLCRSDFSAVLSSSVINVSTTLSFSFTIVNSFTTLEYWIRSAEEMVKPPLNTTTLSSKSFTPSVPGLYFLEARLWSLCNVTSLSVPFFVTGAVTPTYAIHLRKKIATFGDVLLVPVTVSGDNVSVQLRLANDSSVLVESAPLLVSGTMKTTVALPLPADCVSAPGVYTLFLGDASYDLTLRSSCTAPLVTNASSPLLQDDIPFSVTVHSSNFTFLLNTTS